MRTWKNLTRRFARQDAFVVTCNSAENGAAIIGGVVAAVLVEGLKALAARQRTGLPAPIIAGRPLDELLRIALQDERQVLKFGATMGRRTGLGNLWLYYNLAYAPDHYRIADADVVQAFRGLMYAPAIDPIPEVDHG